MLDVTVKTVNRKNEADIEAHYQELDCRKEM